MKKDVLFMCQFFYPEYITSAVLPFETAIDLHKNGYTVGVLCGYPQNYNNGGKVPYHEVVEGIEIERIRYHNFNKNHFTGRLLNYFAFTFSMLLNLRKVKEYKTVIVYSTPPVLPIVSALANLLFQTKVIFVSYDVYPEVAIRTKAVKENSLISKMMKLINKILFKRTSKVVALSSEMKNHILDNRSITSEDIVVIPNWANKIETKERKSVNNPLFNEIAKGNKTIISYFGNMGTAQDMGTIVETIKILKRDENIHFLFAGHGNKMDSLKEIIKAEDLKNVTIFDYLHGKDFLDAQSISDGFIVSLEENLDGLCVPSKTYSYMSAGRPIIAIMESDSDISKDLIEYQAGFSIDNHDSTKMAKVINSLKNKDLVEKMSDNCEKLFLNKYTREKATSAYSDLLKIVLEEN